MLWGTSDSQRRQAQADRRLGTSERYRTATRAELYYLGRQYDHLLDWNERAPMRRKRPLVIIPLYPDAINTLVRFVWSGHRFPRAVVSTTRSDDEVETAGEIGPRLTKDDAARLTVFLDEVVRQGRLGQIIREASTAACITSSCAILLGVRGGYLVAHVEAGKHCAPTFSDDDPRRVTRLEICYQIPTAKPDGLSGVRRSLVWYRRVIDEEMDTTYQEVPVQANVSPTWMVDSSKTVAHGLGFCPVVWVRTFPDSTDNLDGRPVIDPQLYPLLDEVNYAISQRSRAIKNVADPQPIRTGVPVDDRLTLEKSPGSVWDLPAGAKFEFAELKGFGADAATKHLDDMTARFREAVGIVKADPSKISGNMPKIMMDALHEPMIAVAGDLRADLGDDCYCRLLNVALRVIATVTERGEDVWVQGVHQATALIQRAQLAGVWLDFPVRLHWQPFFPASTDEQYVMVQAAKMAQDARLISAQTATAYVAPVFRLDDAKTEHEAIEAEAPEAPEAEPTQGEPPPKHPASR